jgi:DNA-binding XRE family transcriptional regulator
VRAGEFGADVVWSEDIDLSADTLWRLAQEQAGVTMSPEGFRRWRERKAYTLDTAAQALGLSRRMVAYYEQGAKPIPRVVALAARALELLCSSPLTPDPAAIPRCSAPAPPPRSPPGTDRVSAIPPRAGAP